MDECAVGTYTCPENAMCADTDGSYNCTCNQGYTGDGSECQGKPFQRLNQMKYAFISQTAGIRDFTGMGKHSSQQMLMNSTDVRISSAPLFLLWKSIRVHHYTVAAGVNP